MNSRTTQTSFARHLFAARISALTEGRNISIAGEVGVIWATIFILQQNFPLRDVLLWACAGHLASIYSWYSRRFVQQAIARHSQTLVMNNLAFGTWLVASIWGLVPVFFYDQESFMLLIFMISLYAGYVSGALAVTLAYARFFLAFVIGISVPFLGRLFYQGDEVSLTIAALMVFYVAMLTSVSFKLQALFINNARSEYENLELIGQLRTEKENAEKATAAKSQFLASASHDLRQPIHAANLFLDILNTLQTENQSREVLAKVRQSMQGLNKMLHGLLDISRLDASAVENSPENVSLNEIINPLVAEQKVVNRDVNIENHLPEAVQVFADPMLVERIVRNLLDNAVKYTRKGSIQLTCVEHQGGWRLRLSDTGIGIPADKLDTIFDEFIQLNNPERNRQKGLGLGLAIVRRLCHLAGFELNISSELGKGTQVTLLLPKGSGEPSLLAVGRYQDLAGLKVLVVDDESDIREGMQLLLEQWGCNVITAADQASASAAMQASRFVPDLLIADLRLQNHQSGIDLIHHFQARFGDQLQAILVTGDTAPERVHLASQSGAEVVYKPIDGEALKACIQNLYAKQAA